MLEKEKKLSAAYTEQQNIDARPARWSSSPVAVSGLSLFATHLQASVDESRESVLPMPPALPEFIAGPETHPPHRFFGPQDACRFSLGELRTIPTALAFALLLGVAALAVGVTFAAGAALTATSFAARKHFSGFSHFD